MSEQGISDTFTFKCACGEAAQVVGGVEQPHECRPITAQQVRDAWADGYEFGRREATEETQK